MQTAQTKKDRSRLVPLTYPAKMIAKEYQNLIRNELGHATYLFLTLLVASLQVLKQVKLERLAEALPLPILFESRRKKLQRFLKLEVLNIETLWCNYSITTGKEKSQGLRNEAKSGLTER